MSGAIKINKSISTLQNSREMVKKQLAEQDHKLRQASSMYETHFLNEMVKAMRSTVKHSGLTKPSMAQKIYQDKMDQQYVEKWGQVGGVGLGQLIYTQIKERFYNAHGIPLNQQQGPIPIEKGRVLEVKPGPENNAIPMPNKPVKEMSLLLEAEALKDQSAVDVSSPWNGQIQQVLNDGIDQQIVKIKHDNKLTSLLSFKGLVNMAPGQEIAAGQKVGTLLGESNSLIWKVTENV